MTQPTSTASGAELIAAAQAVIDRWDTPLWKDVPATAEYIGRLRAALASAAAPAEQPSMSNVTHDWRDSPSYGGEICANCGAVNGTRRSKLACGQKTETPQRRWPFAETPGEFTERLREAMQGSGDLLAAVRHVLIERPALVVPHTPLAAAAAPQPNTAYAALPEPDSYLFQHDETGLTQHVDAQQVEWGFERNNPRLRRVSGTFTEPQMRAFADATCALRTSRGQAPAQAAPAAVASPGWKLVPVEPTPEMWKAARAVPDPNPPYPPHYALVWDAMLAAAPSTQSATQLPERDASIPAEQQGLFRKFDVRRLDGTDKPGSKHHGCTYFVLDVDHDPCARPALAAYAAACEATHPALAADLRTKWSAATAPQPAPASQGDALPREELAWMVVQEACETEPADEDDPECIRILRRDLKSSVLAAFLRHDAARAAQEGRT